MDNGQILKKRALIIIWTYFILSLLVCLASKQFLEFRTGDAFTVSQFLLVPFLLANIIMSFYKDRIDVGKHIIITVFLAFLTAFIVAESIPGQTLQSIFLLIFIFPIIMSSFYYQPRVSFLMTTIIIILDASIYVVWQKIFLGKSDFFSIFNYVIPIRFVFYYLITFLVAYIKEDRKNENLKLKMELNSNLEKKEEFSQLVESLTQKNQILESEIEKIRDNLQAGYLSKESRLNTILLNLSKTITKDLDLGTVLSTTLVKIREIISFQAAAIFMLNGDRTDLFIAAHEGLYRDEMEMNLSADLGFPNKVAKSARFLYVADTSEDPRFESIIKTARISSALYVPIQLDAVNYGVICLWAAEKNAYNEDDIQLLHLIAGEAARSVKNAELYKKLDTRLNFIVNLWETSKRLTSSVDLSSTWEKSMEEALNTTGYLFNADKIIFFQHHVETNELLPGIGIHVAHQTKNSLIININNESDIQKELLNTNIQIKDLASTDKIKALVPMAERENVRSLLWTPLIGRNRFVGALALFSAKPRVWTSEQIQWLDIFTNLFSMTLENILLLQDLVVEKNQLQTLIDNVPEGVFTTDVNRCIQTWNKAAEKITGYNIQDVIGRDCKDVIHCNSIDKEFCNEEACIVNRVLNNNEKVDSGLDDFYLLNKSKDRTPIFISSVPILNDEGQTTGALVVFRDITKEKEIEKMKEELLATITHDLKSPLASIMGYTELLLHPKMGPLNGEQKEFLDAILRSLQVLQILIGNILISSRMQIEKININPQNFSLYHLLEELEEMFRPLFAHKSQNFYTSVDENLVVYGDRERIREIFLNLIGNAVKFTPEKGKISIEANKIADKTGEKDLVEVKVFDTGRGIPESEIGKLFQKFSQVKGEKRGTGLGLYICRKILEAHKQSIRVESQIGQGTKFIFTLELSTEKEMDISKD